MLPAYLNPGILDDCLGRQPANCKTVYGWLQVKCRRCETEASIPLEHVRRPRDTPIWKLEAALKCRSCRKGRYAIGPRATN